MYIYGCAHILCKGVGNRRRGSVFGTYIQLPTPTCEFLLIQIYKIFKILKVCIAIIVLLLQNVK